MKRFFICTTACLGLVLGAPHIGARDIQVVSEEFPPYNYTQNGQFSGVSTEVVMAVFKELGINPDVKVFPWARAYKTALRNSHTLIFTIGRNAKREELFHWIGVIAPAKSYLFALRGREDISIATLEDAKRYKIGTVREDVREQYLLSKGFAKGKNIYPNTSYEANLKVLLNGRIDLWGMSELSAYYLLEKNGLNSTETVKKAYFLEELSKGGYYMAFNRETPIELVERFRDALQKIKDDGVYQKILARYTR